jgi:hypothetical protein
MLRRFSLPAFAVFLPGVGWAAPVPQEPSVSAVETRLAAEYPLKYPRKSGDLAFVPETEVVEFVVPALRAALPGTRFFRTELDTGYSSCFPTVDVVVLVRVTGGKLVTYDFLAPSYQGVDDGLRAFFRTVSGKTAEERTDIGRGVASLYRTLTYRGRLGHEVLAGDRYQVELWTDGQHWRQRLIVTFGPTGGVTGIDLKSVESP